MSAMLVYETSHFEVVAPERPHVDRTEGGHIKIIPKQRVRDRTELSATRAMELMLLTMVVGKAMDVGLNRRGIDVGRINYQDNGNWGVSRTEGPCLHIHLYGRAKSATVQKYGDALFLPHRHTGFYEDVSPLSLEDVEAVQEEIRRIVATPEWGASSGSIEDE